MATLQQIQEAARLKREKWLTPAQAVEQVRTATSTANPPINPPTPTPTGQTMQGVNGEIFQIAPVNPQTGLSAPTQPVVQPTEPVQPATATQQATTTPTTAPTTPQTATQPTAQDKTAEIQAKNQAQMELNKQKSQLAIEERKRQAEEAKQASIPTDEKWVLNTLISGGSVAPQNTQAFRNAQFKYKNYQKFNSMSPTQLLDNMKMGEIDTETSQLLASNPNYIKAKEDFDRFQKNQSINNMVRSTYGWATGKTEEVDYYGKSQSEVAKRLGVTETNAEAFARIVSGSPLVTQLTQTVSNTAKQLNELNNERNNVYADLKKQYPDLSASAIMTLMGQRTQGLTDQINALNSTLTLTQADLKNAMEMAKLEYEAVSEDIEWQMKIASEQRGMENSLALSQMQFDQQIAQQAQTMGTPELAIPSVINQYAEMGIMASKSAQQHIADAKAFIARGGTLGEYISQMQRDFQAKPAYLAKFGTQKDTKPFEVGNQTYQYNPTTGNYEVISPITAWTGGDLRYLASQFPWQAWAKNNNPAGITWNANFDNGTWTAALLKQAGINYSKGTARPANEGGNYVTFATIEDGLKAQQIIMSQTYGNSTVGQMLASWVWTGEWVNYAKQVAGMAWITDLNAKVSSLTPEQLSALQMAKIKKESPWLYWILSQPSQPTSQYNDQNIADLAYLVELQEKNPTQASKDMKELWYTARDIANYKAGNVPLTDKQKQTSVSVIDDIKDLVTNYDWNDATGVHFGMPVISWTDRADTLQKIDQLVAKMTLPNLGSLKWPMSDKDLAFITKASSNLSAELSDVQFEKNLIQAYNVAARRAWLPEVESLDEIKWNTPVKQTVGGEKAYSKYE